MKQRSRILRTVFGLAVATLLMHAAGTQSYACTYYASPTGTGNGTSSSSPFKIANFWSVARPGTVLCLMDGQYTGSASMINPPKNLSGTTSARITVKALNDGKVTINGQGSGIPVRLYYNSYFILEGFNAANSAGTVVTLSYSNNNIIRRVAAWDAFDGNYNVFGIHNGTYNLLQDVAGWGIARKIFSASQGGNFTTLRRTWGRWEGSHVVGPKMTYTMAYNNYGMIIENAIGTWSGERMKQTYTLLDYYGKPWTGNGAGTYTNYAVNQPYGIFGIDGFSGDKNARSKLLGSIAYVLGSDRFHPAQAVFVTKIDSLEINNTAAYIQPGYHADKSRFALYNLQSSTGYNLVAKHLTGIGGKGSYYGSEWKKSSISEGSTSSVVPNVFSSTTAANLCYRYHDGVLTNQPLWPWPMNQRIASALIQSGRKAVDVTSQVEAMLGTIPANCKTTEVVSPSPTPAPSPTVTVPSAPANLQVSP